MALLRIASDLGKDGNKDTSHFWWLEIYFITLHGKNKIMAATLDITDMYMGILSSLPNDAKLDLIGRLTASMRVKKKKAAPTPIDVFSCFHADWGGDKSPEEIAEELRKSRTFTREVETW